MQLKIWLLFYIPSIFYIPPIIINSRCITLKKMSFFGRIKFYTSLERPLLFHYHPFLRLSIYPLRIRRPI
jgi:hypothetical protein